MSLVPNDRYGSKSGFLTLGPVTSGVPSSSDNLGPVPHFGFGPLTDSCIAAKRISFDHLVGASEIDQPCMAPIQPAMARPISSGESSWTK